jgi:uncharacterized LabA/DUF88 family protein
VDRCALFVDAGYVLADGAMAVHGTRRRDSVSWDYAGLLQLFGNLAAERTREPLLRCYWYESTMEGRRSADHDALADLPGVKLRLAKKRPGRKEGVEGEIHRDLTMLARNKAVSDVMLISAEEDLAQVISDVQDMGLRVTLLQIVADGEVAASRALRQECDDVVEVSAEHLRPYVELISGAEPSRADEPDTAATNTAPADAASAVGANGNGYHQALAAAPQEPAAQEDTPFAAEPASTPAPAEPEQPEWADAPAAAQSADFVPALEQPAAAQEASVGYGSAPDYLPAAEYQPAGEYGAADYRRVPDYQTPVAGGAPLPGGNPALREDFYAAPVPVLADELPGERDRVPVVSRLGADYPGYAPGGAREPYQRDSGFRELAGDPNGRDRLQPVPVASPPAGGASAQIRRLPARGPGAGPLANGQPGFGQAGPAQGGFGQPGPGQGGFGQPTAAETTVVGLPPAVPLPGGHSSVGQPTGGQPVAPVAPMDRDPNGMNYQGGRGAAPGGPRPVVPGPGAPGGPVGLAGPAGPGVNPGPGVGQVPFGGPQPAGAHAPNGVGGPGPAGQPEMSGPLGLVGQNGYNGGAPGVSLADAVQSAHEEGQAFGDSVARDAPALWLEAVLARKPRMPSDLEARLLQGSALPIDFLLHDEVRHALRRGFWDALERARR